MARSQGAPADLLVQESAAALGAFWDDPAALVAACRRIVDRQLTCAPLWWLCARLLCSDDPRSEARSVVTELADDPTARQLAHAFPSDISVVVIGWPEQSMEAFERRGDVEVIVVDVEGDAHSAVRRLESMDVEAVEVPSRNIGAAVAESDLVVLDAMAVGPGVALAASGSTAAAAVARAHGTPVWLAAGAGRLLPQRMWDALCSRWSGAVDPLEAGEELLSLDLVDRIAGIGGVVDVAEGLRHTDCPVAPELFRLVG